MADSLVEKKSDAAYEVGTWIGRRQAFAALAGNCSAADAECLRQVRDRKQYRALGMNWDDFCQQRVGISRKTVEQIIRRLEEFGPQYFTLAQVTGVTPEEYRRIAGSVSEQGLVHAGVTIPIAAENASRLNEAVEALRRLPQSAPAAEETSAQDRALGKVERSLSSAVTGIEQLHEMPLDAQQQDRLSGIVIDHLKRLSLARAAAFRRLQQEDSGLFLLLEAAPTENWGASGWSKRQDRPGTGRALPVRQAPRSIPCNGRRASRIQDTLGSRSR